jgi:hypothetical protein
MYHTGATSEPTEGLPLRSAAARILLEGLAHIETEEYDRAVDVLIRAYRQVRIALEADSEWSEPLAQKDHLESSIP